jgi:hypothetical protein
MLNYRDKYGLQPKRIKTCAECGIEHAGRCHFIRNRKHKPHDTTVEQIREWNARAKARRRELFLRRFIRELCDGIDEGRNSARRANRQRPAAKKRARVSY